MPKTRSENPRTGLREGLSALVVLAAILLLLLPALPLSAQPLGWAAESCGTGDDGSGGSGDGDSGDDDGLDTWDNDVINAPIRTGPGVTETFFEGLGDLTSLLLGPWAQAIGVAGAAEHPERTVAAPSAPAIEDL